VDDGKLIIIISMTKYEVVVVVVRFFIEKKPLTDAKFTNVINAVNKTK